MRHHSKTRILSRTRRGREGLLRGLAVQLIERGKVTTTTAKAKELRPFAERLITYGKSGTMAARRRVASQLGEPTNAVIQKLFDEVATQYKDRQGGYTRIVKIGRTPAGRDEAIIELV